MNVCHMQAARRAISFAPTRTSAFVRPITCSAIHRQASAPTPSSSTQPADASSNVNVGPKTPSSVPEGTVLKGINILKDGKDPVAKADKEYPDWLWSLLEPKKIDFAEEEKLSITYLRKMTKEKIKANSLAKRSR
ncbi:hypothetical protein PhCBS80983_g02053 [Powellomyces hirtus]|uniref:Large ribosomal subunit protein mL54 n=1 Tax=Powellomyces hirtus TaxID=109895 RepID=A0A507E848_9FUNG|nr:hypothetical protein PhCBS80983_g02053 [Powellomyces hirtus]